MSVQVWAISDTGRARKANEDAYLVAPDLGLVAVADGMGGFQRGDVASELACRVLREVVAAGVDHLAAFRAEPTEAHRDAVLDLLEDGVQQACRQVHETSLSLTGEGGRMGTTLDAVLVVGTTAFLVHVGDGRVFLSRGGELHPLTEDHTLVQQQLNEGLIDEAQARTARNKNVITRALGVFASVLVDSLAFEIDPRDRFVLCTDGLHRYIGKRELGFVLGQAGPEQAARQLVDAANERGGRDNITVAIAGLASPEAADRVADDRTRERMDVLRQVDLFQSCTYRQLLEFTQQAREVEARPGQELFEDGAPGEDFYVIVSGRVSIEKQGTVLAELGPGHYFGELVLVDRPVRSATARALTEARFLVMGRAGFQRVIRQDGALGTAVLWQMLRKLAQHLRSTNERLVHETITLEELEPDLPRS